MSAKKKTARDASATSAGGKPLRVVILDSHAVLHRAYHAIPGLSSSKGEPTGALYGLTTMLLKAIDDLEPDYFIAARDLPGGTHRHELFEEYKATRAKAEDELVVQLGRAPEVFKAFGIPVYEKEGYEADDIIGAIVKQLRERRDIEIIIATGDMDTLQLVEGSRVRVYTLRKGFNDTALYDEDAVKERFGFGPEYITDLKGIMGDPSDNIPGVRGVGEGSALKLIQAFGGIDGVYAAIKSLGVEGAAEKSGVQKRYVQRVADDEQAARFSKQLATIHADVPIVFELPDHPWSLLDHADGIVALCDAYEFRSIRDRIRRAGAPHETPTANQIDPRALKEASIALWLLHSDTVDPSLEDVLQYAQTADFEEARERVFAKLHETGRLTQVYERIERPLIPIVERMNGSGVYIDVPHLAQLAREYGAELGAVAERVFRHAGREFNVNSPKQLAAVLFDELKISPGKQKKTPTGARTTKESELEKLAGEHPIVADVLAYRELQKLLSTYVEKMPTLVGADGRLHAEFLQAGTTTGRMASKNPNLQNIPVKTAYGRRIREAFAAPKGKLLLSLDYSQIELRIAAGLSGDEKLVGTFKRGGDIHTAVASEVFGVPPEEVDYEMRRRAKVINFGILYGMGVNALRANLAQGSSPDRGVSREEAARFLADYFKNFSGLAHYIERTKVSAAHLGYTETLFGRRRYFPAFASALDGLRAQAERMAINAPIQGTQADIIKLAMVEADARITRASWRDRVALVLQVHDELVYEADEEIVFEVAAIVREAMESVVPTEQLSGVPILAEGSVGSNWGRMERIARV